MALQGEQSAILRNAPAPASASGDPFKSNKLAVSAGASSAATALSTPGSGGFYTFKARGGDITIVFGDSNVAAATANDMVIIAGTSEDWWVPPTYTHFRAFGIAAGDLHWCRSSQ